MKDNSNNLFIHKLLKAIADSIIKVFIPLYILKVSQDINLSMLYLVIYSAFCFLFNIVLKRPLQKYGLIFITISFIPIIITEAILSFSEITYITTILSAFFMSLCQVFYSVPINLVLALGDRNINVSKFEIGTNIGKLIFILVSGIILGNVEGSFLILSIISSIFYILSIIPIGFSYSLLKEAYKEKTESLGLVNPVKRNSWFTIFHISFGCFQVIIDDILPLWLFINNLSFASVATVIAIVEAAKLIANYMAKKIHQSKITLFSFIAVTIYILTIIFALFTHNPLLLYIITCICSISFPLVFVPMFHYFCSVVKENGSVLNEMVRRDIDIFSFRHVCFGLSFIWASLIPCFIYGIASSVIMLGSEFIILKKDGKV